MRAHIVHCHPEPTSFNAALTDTARTVLESQGYGVTVTDLYADGFDPVEDARHYVERTDGTRFSALAEQRHASERGSLAPEIRREIDRLTAADLLVLQFPVWWHGAPAMMKGWFDRVFVSGGLYTSRQRYDRGIFRGKRAICSVTAGAPAAAFGPGQRAGDLDQILWSTHYSLHYMGFSVLPPFLADGVQGHGFSYRDDDAASALRASHLAAWRTRLEQVPKADPIRFPGWADWEKSDVA